MKWFYSIAVFMIMVSSCVPSSNKTQDIHTLDIMKGQKIKFPPSMTFVVQGDTVDYDFNDCDYKIFCFIDSVDCAICKMNLIGWDQFLADINSHQDLSVNFVMAVNTGNVEEITKQIEKYHFNYPISIDNHCLVKSMNHIPENPIYQTFLLDENDNIVIIGNPLLDSDIRLKYEQKLGLFFDSIDLSGVSLSQKHIPLGAFSEKEEKQAKFRLFNNGDKPAIIQDIYTSCSCTSAWADTDTILPNGYMDIHLRCQPQKGDGYFVRYIDVLLNENRNISLSISGIMEIED